MTVKRLIEELECFDDDMEVVMQQGNSIYVDWISGTETNELRVFYGGNTDVVVLISNGQAGAV